MKLHGNARLSPKGRLLLCRRVLDEGWSLAAAAKAVGVSERTASKWVARHRTEGEAGLVDRSSAPEHVPGRTDEERVELIASLRRLRMTGAEIAECLGMAFSTVSEILTRIGLGKLSRLELPEPPNRYQCEHPGELIHIDVKKLGRIGQLAQGTKRPAARAPASAPGGPAGSSCMCASTTPPAWPTSRYCQTSELPLRSDSSDARSRSTAPAESSSSG